MRRIRCNSGTNRIVGMEEDAKHPLLAAFYPVLRLRRVSSQAFLLQKKGAFFMQTNTRKLTRIAMLSAIAYVVMLVARFPVVMLSLMQQLRKTK